MDIFPIIQAAEEAVHVAESDPSIVGMFGLNWKLFLAQLVNFGIVLLILWKWVFEPVTRALEKRTKRIEDSLKNAELVETQKRDFETWRLKETNEAKKAAAEIISQAKVDAEKVREEILVKAKVEQEKLIETGRNSLKLEKEQMVREAKEELAEVVVSAVAKILGEKMDSKKDVELVKRIISGVAQ